MVNIQYVFRCDNMTVVLVCLLQNESWDELCEFLKWLSLHFSSYNGLNLGKKCNRPRPPTPSPEDDSDGSQSGFETPPVTPIHRNYSGKKPGDSALGPGLTSCAAPLLIPDRCTNAGDQPCTTTTTATVDAKTVVIDNSCKTDVQPETSSQPALVELPSESPVATPPKVSRLANTELAQEDSEDEMPPTHFEVAVDGRDEVAPLLEINEIKSEELQSAKTDQKVTSWVVRDLLSHLRTFTFILNYHLYRVVSFSWVGNCLGLSVLFTNRNSAELLHIWFNSSWPLALYFLTAMSK